MFIFDTLRTKRDKKAKLGPGRVRSFGDLNLREDYFKLFGLQHIWTSASNIGRSIVESWIAEEVSNCEDGVQPSAIVAHIIKQLDSVKAADSIVGAVAHGLFEGGLSVLDQEEDDLVHFLADLIGDAVFEQSLGGRSASNKMHDFWAIRGAAIKSFTDVAGFRLPEIEKGYIGLFKGSVQPGDSVYVLKGSSVPVLLRQAPESDHFIHLGTYVVSGLMHGEAASFVKEGKMNIQTIEIR